MRPRSVINLLVLSICATAVSACAGGRQQSAYYLTMKTPLVAATSQAFEYAQIPIDQRTDDYVHSGTFVASEVWSFEELTQRLQCGDRFKMDELESVTLEVWVRVTEKLTNPMELDAKRRADLDYSKAQLGGKGDLKLKSGSRSCALSHEFTRTMLEQVGILSGVQALWTEPPPRDPMLPGLTRR